ncbi:S53 family serine peptidase [Candidatus Binatus sp.]|uniref:S53 family peptidase n=1 Tax=Candidatus Binatus sp. TaxID=2811406 RepID=UPI002F929E8E
MGRTKTKIRSVAAAVISALAAATFATSADAAVGSVKILGNHPAEAAELAGQGSVASDRQLGMQLTLALHNRADLDRLLAAQQDPSSPQYHHWISTAEFDARFGPTGADVEKVSSWLAQSGFTVDSASTRTRTIKFHATAAVAQKKFGVSIAASPDGKYFANLEDPALPADIAPLVANLRGLSNMHASLAAVNTSELKPANADASPEIKFGKLKRFGPNDLYTFYDETPLLNDSVDGAGADCIAILEDSDFDWGSVAQFNTQFGLPSLSLTTVYADGSSPGENPYSPDYIEAELDAQYGHAAAPGAPMIAYVGNGIVAESEGSDPIIDALSRAVSDNSCGVISISFSLCGAEASLFTGTIDPLLAEAASHNVGVYVSSGDVGSQAIVFSAQTGGCVFAKERGVNELAADPHATGVGGTAFSPKYSKTGADRGHIKEHVWNDRTGASGGGQSAIFPKPSFQSSVIPADLNRDVPDISLAASPLKPGFSIYLDGILECCIGGTSLSTPYWAGIGELVAQQAGAARTGNINTRLYTLGALANPTVSGLRDVTKGSNGFHGVAGFKATKGYDKATGWGTPDIAVLVPALAGP